MTYRYVLSGLAALALLAAIGCAPAEEKKPTEPAKPATPAAAAVTGADLDGVAKADKPFKLALIVKTRNNPFFDPMIKAAEEAANELGVTLEVQAPPQEGDKEIQFSMVQNVVAKGVDAILIAPADSKGIVPALKQAADKGVLVVNIDNRVDAASAAAAGLASGGYVGANNEEGGRLAGEKMASLLGGKCDVAILEGIRGADNAEARKRGFEAGVKDKLTVASRESAEWDTQKAYAKFQSMLAAKPNLAGVFCANDKMAIGAMKAIQEAGKQGKIAVIGYDNIPDVKAALAAGDLKATIEQHPDLMGRYGVKMAVGMLSGKLAKGGEFLVPLEVVTK
ncbi:MAG: substrate-binding domain-containing protein [Armatimonadetes bacterium]|nr:substrate-binding domain-containing protein [Armatimonadota bacterium]